MISSAQAVAGFSDYRLQKVFRQLPMISDLDYMVSTTARDPSAD
jgi:hypothetical protein